MVRYSFPVGLFHSLLHAGLSRCTHNLGTTPREDFVCITSNIVLAFECTFVAREDSGTYVCDYPRVQEQGKGEVEPKCHVINSDGINRRDKSSSLA